MSSLDAGLLWLRFPASQTAPILRRLFYLVANRIFADRWFKKLKGCRHRLDIDINYIYYHILLCLWLTLPVDLGVGSLGATSWSPVANPKDLLVTVVLWWQHVNMSQPKSVLHPDPSASVGTKEHFQLLQDWLKTWKPSSQCRFVTMIGYCDLRMEVSSSVGSMGIGIKIK